jgi:hypothetical protein
MKVGIVSIAIASVLTGCALPGSTSAGGSNPLAGLALHGSDAPGGFVRCSGFSGRYPSVSASYVDGYADGAAWRAAGTGGAQDAWIEVYENGSKPCSSYRTASDPVADGSAVLQNIVQDYGDPVTAHRAYEAGQFVPAEPAGLMTGQPAPLYGTVSRGTTTGLGPDSFVDSGSVADYTFLHAAWQKGRYVVTVFAERASIDAARATAVAIDARITSAGAVPSRTAAGSTPCQGTLGQGSGSISGDQLVFPGSQVPSLKIFAVRVGGAGYCYVITSTNQRTYTIAGLPPGRYQVLAYHITAQGTVRAGYTKAVACGLTAACDDHSLVAVSVAEGQAVTGINPNDYYTQDVPPPPH